ncbi:MAG: hypothetical protein ACE5Q5_03950 [Nitrosarchaeum sp.]
MNFHLKNKALFGMILFLTLSLVIVNPADAGRVSPREQMEQGIKAQDITCNSGLSLVVRSNGFAACVSAATAEKLEKRGLGKIEKVAEEIPKEIKIKDLEKNTIKESTPINNSKEIQVIPASTGSVINFYITDDDLNLAHNGVDVVSTQGLFEFSINGISINGPSSMIETGPNTGVFYVKLQLPDTINGRPLNQNDVVSIKYLDVSDSTGDKQTITKSIPLTNAFAKVETYGGGSRIGHEFTVRIYEPDANLDSKENDRISLNKLEYRGKGGIRTTLANSAFDANSSYLIETGKNTNTFEVKIKIPRYIDGKLVDIGDWYEIRYIDSSTPSGTDEKIVLQGKIG